MSIYERETLSLLSTHVLPTVLIMIDIHPFSEWLSDHGIVTDVVQDESVSFLLYNGLPVLHLSDAFN